MPLVNTFKAAMAMAAILPPVEPPVSLTQNLVLADCGIGMNPMNTSWSTSRQMNWYHGDIWSSANDSAPASPDLVVEMPYNDGKYPWNYEGASATFFNGETWSVWIEDGTPEPLLAGKALGTQDGGTTLSCYTYRHPIGLSASGNTTCMSAFVCNHRENGPTPWAVIPGTAPDNVTAPATPAPTNVPIPSNDSVTFGGTLGVSIKVSPRPAVWYGTIGHFLSSIIFTTEGVCSPNPFTNRLNSTVTARCQGTSGHPLNILPILFDALKNLGSLPYPDGLFAHNSGIAANDTSDDTVTLPTTFNMTVSDPITGEFKGFLGYEMQWPQSGIGAHCNECNVSKFDDNYNAAIASAFQILHPIYSQVIIESTCNFNVLCW